MNGEYSQAIAKTDALLRVRPDDPSALAVKAVGLALMGDANQSRSLSDAAIAAGDSASGAPMSLALLAAAVVADGGGQAADVVSAAFRRAVQASPRLTLPYYLWAVSLERRGKTAECRQVLVTGVRATRGAAWAMKPYRTMAERLRVGKPAGARRPAAGDAVLGAPNAHTP